MLPLRAALLRVGWLISMSGWSSLSRSSWKRQSDKIKNFSPLPSRKTNSAREETLKRHRGASLREKRGEKSFLFPRFSFESRLARDIWFFFLFCETISLREREREREKRYLFDDSLLSSSALLQERANFCAHITRTNDHPAERTILFPTPRIIQWISGSTFY